MDSLSNFELNLKIATDYLGEEGFSIESVELGDGNHMKVVTPSPVLRLKEQFSPATDIDDAMLLTEVMHLESTRPREICEEYLESIH